MAARICAVAIAVVLVFLLVVLAALLLRVARAAKGGRGKLRIEYSGGAEALQWKVVRAHFAPEPLDTLTLLDVGSGNGARLLKAATAFRSAVGVEPSRARYEAAVKANEVAGAPAVLIRGYLDDAPGKFDVIRYEYSFHALPELDVAPAVAKLCPGGLLVILEPSLEPRGKASNRLNIDSPEFDPRSWERFAASLQRARDYLSAVPNVREYKLPRGRALYALAAPDRISS